MALYDDKWWLLSHISNSFVLSDDSGCSELVMTAKDASVLRESAEKMAHEEGTHDFLEPLDLIQGEDFQPNSFEIRLRRNQMGYHRPRCNTELKLEKLKRDRKNMPKIKTIVWKENNSPLTNEEIDDLFPVTQLKNKTEENSKFSLLAYQLKVNPPTATNPFEVFSKFDGSAVSTKEKTRTLKIYLDFQEEEKRDYPMQIQVLGSASVQEVIGFICWKYSREKRMPALKPKIDSYALFMAEEDGTIEKEFPSLDRREAISKFGFPILGLVDVTTGHTSSPDGKDTDRQIKVVLPDGTFTILELETRNIPLKEIIERAFSRRKTNIEFNHNIEKKDKPGEPLDKESLLSNYEVNEFYIVREHSKRKQEKDSFDPRLKHQISLLEAPMYKEFTNVFMINKVRAKVEVMLSISENKIEIYPKDNSYKLWHRNKPYSYNMDDILTCDILEKKNDSKWTFKFVINTEHGYKSHEFVSSSKIAGEINSKMNHLIYWQPCETREAYLAQKDKKDKNKKKYLS